jgi:hypothetical protein
MYRGMSRSKFPFLTKEVNGDKKSTWASVNISTLFFFIVFKLVKALVIL